MIWRFKQTPTTKWYSYLALEPTNLSVKILYNNPLPTLFSVELHVPHNVALFCVVLHPLNSLYPPRVIWICIQEVLVTAEGALIDTAETRYRSILGDVVKSPTPAVHNNSLESRITSTPPVILSNERGTYSTIWVGGGLFLPLTLKPALPTEMPTHP